MNDSQSTARVGPRPSDSRATRSPFMRPAGGRRRRFGTSGLSPGQGLALTAATLVLVFLALVAFARTQALKQVDPPIEGLRAGAKIMPGCDCPRDDAELAFRLVDAQAVDAVVVDEENVPVRTLATGAPTPSGEVTLEWDGTDDAGRIVPGGRYRLRLDLRETDRSITVPDEVVVRPAR